jgi:hypothetical protein
MSDLLGNNRAWDMITEGNVTGAISIYDKIIANKPGTIALNNRGVAYLLSGDLDKAAEDFDHVRRLPGPTSLLVPLVGTTYWLQGKRLEACEEWSSELRRLEIGEISHHDEAGSGVPGLLWWASAHEEFSSFRFLAVKALKRLWKQKWVQNSLWPGSLVPYLLGELSEEMVHEAACRPWAAKDLNRVKRCFVVQFYEATKILDSGDTEGYRTRMRSLVEEYSTDRNSLFSKPEYHLAIGEMAGSTTDAYESEH